MRNGLVLGILVFLLACSRVPAPLPSSPTTGPIVAPRRPTATPSPTLPPTQTPTPTIPSTPTPTPGPYGEVVAGFHLAVTYKRAEWKAREDIPPNTPGYLIHKTIPGCTMKFGMATEWPRPPKRIRLFGYEFLYATWQYEGKTYRLYSGPDGLEDWGIWGIPVLISVPTARFPACEKAALEVLRTFHFDAAWQENCPYAQQSPFRKGMRVRTLTYVYIRSEPRWAEETRITQLRPGVEMTILDGPICAPYPKGVYVYWKVRFDDGSTAWIAEGDAREKYIERVR